MSSPMVDVSSYDRDQDYIFNSLRELSYSVDLLSTRMSYIDTRLADIYNQLSTFVRCPRRSDRLRKKQKLS